MLAGGAAREASMFAKTDGLDTVSKKKFLGRVPTLARAPMPGRRGRAPMPGRNVAR